MFNVVFLDGPCKGRTDLAISEHRDRFFVLVEEEDDIIVYRRVPPPPDAVADSDAVFCVLAD